MTTKRALPESNEEQVYVFDKDYRSDPWDRTEMVTLVKPYIPQNYSKNLEGCSTLKLVK